MNQTLSKWRKLDSFKGLDKKKKDLRGKCTNAAVDIDTVATRFLNLFRKISLMDCVQKNMSCKIDSIG